MPKTERKKNTTEEIENLGVDYTVVKGLADGIISEATVTAITKGLVKDFVKNEEKWENSLDNPAIELTIESVHDGHKIEFTRMLTLPADGTSVDERSNLGKFIQTYGQPKVGTKVKTISKNGFQRLLLP